MKRTQRINRISRKHPRPRSKFWPIVLVLAGIGALLQVLLVGAVVTGAGVAAVGYYNKVSAQGLQRLKHTSAPADVQPTRILDRNGHLLLQITNPNAGLHKNVPLARIPRYMREAIIASEDKTFYTNHGIDPVAIAKALYDDVRYRGAYLGGASTITEQLIKQLLFPDIAQSGNLNQTIQRKLQEMVIAYAVARPGTGFSKDRILYLYLNTTFFGHQAYGVEAAARVFFGKHIWQLDLAQCALLAGLVQAPTTLDPLGPYGPAPSEYRARTHVLVQMRRDGFITARQEQAAAAEVARFRFSAPQWRLTSTQSLAPYWTDWIQHLLTYGPAEDRGWYTDPKLAAIVARAGGLDAGLTIKTTLDLNMYRQAQQIMNGQVSEIAYNNVHDAAVVTLDPRTAECLAMVGGLDYYSSETGSQINMAAFPRSPGSSFKVFTYVTAFEHGWSPATMLLDEPKTWPDPSEPSGVYAPKNYDLSWHGAVTVRMALANSYNMPAVKTIAAIGVAPVIKTAIDMGLWDLRGQHAGLSLTLGSIPVPLWQMAQAYNVFANGGVFRPMDSVLSIKDAAGNTLYQYKPPAGVQVIAPQYAYLITSILKDNYARVAAFGQGSVLQLGPDAVFPTNVPAAVKTGTSQSFKDNLTIGYTPNLLTATWVGNPSDQAMINVEGIDGAGPIWHDMMEWSLQHLNLPIQDFTQPPGVILARVSSSGYLASNYTVWPITDYFAAGSLPHRYDNGTGNNYTAYHILPYTFSVDGGTTSGMLAGDVSLTPISTTSPGGPPVAGVTVTGTPGATSGSSGTIPYNPGSHANLCNGGYYTYAPIYDASGHLTGYRYTCH